MFFSFGSFIFALILAEVTPWTIDLPEARKFLFEKNERIEKKRHESKYEVEKRNFFSNRYNSNSKHHEDHHDGHHEDHLDDYDDSDPYAKDYEYQSYTEKKVRGIVYEGSQYLEGLQRSIEHFTEVLENCTRKNQTNQRFPFNTTLYNSINSTTFNFTSLNTSEPWRPMSEGTYNETNFNSTEQCRNVTRASEHVRRLAELAIKATKELQDIAYSRKHMKDDPYELSQQENEQILKLAWFLDRLAYYTDFHPQPKRFLQDGYPISTTTVAPVANLLNASEETKRLMMNCLKQKSEVPATIRCAYPQEIPSVVQFMINNSNPLPGGMPSPSNRNEKVVSPATSEQELLIASDYSPMYQPYHHLSSVTHVKRSVPEDQLSMSFESARQKRAISQPEDSNSKKEHPAITFMKYFVKHKVWESANPTDVAKDFQHFEVNNEIHEMHRTKRDAGKRLRIPEDPYQDLSKYIKSKKGVNYVKDEAQAQKIRAYIDKILNSKPETAKEQSRRISKLFRSKRSNSFRSETNAIENKFRSKRSYTYETDVDKPRDPDDLFKDISYYIKNRPGTNYNRDFVQAAQLRAGLLQIFANPNIETVRRYGSNFNPLIPDPMLFSSLRSAADN